MNFGIQELVEAKLAGNCIDSAGFIEQMFQVASEVGKVQCTLACDSGLRFEFPGQPACDVGLDAARGKLRMLCARLGVICNEQSGKEVSLYGGDAVFYYGPREQGQWKVCFHNTPAQHEFTIELQQRTAGPLTTDHGLLTKDQ
jgi:hypothetical protein